MLLVVVMQPASQAEELKTELFYKIPHFSSGNNVCSTQPKNKILDHLKLRGVAESEYEGLMKALLLKLDANDVLSPFISGENILFGTSMRGLSFSPNCHNFLFHCTTGKESNCRKITEFSNDEVIYPIFYKDGIIIAHREKFDIDKTETGVFDFIISHDDGKKWDSIKLPDLCVKNFYVCSLIPQTESEYKLTLVNLKLFSPDNDFGAIFLGATYDGGKNWEISNEKWRGGTKSSKVSFRKNYAFSINENSEEFIEISKYNFSTKSTEIIKTPFSAKQWSSIYQTMVIEFDDYYLIRLHGAERGSANNSAIFKLAKNDESVPYQLLWKSNDQFLNDFQTSKNVILLRTTNDYVSILAPIKTSEKLHYSIDNGVTWTTLEVPYYLTGAIVHLSENKVWFFKSSGIEYIDLSELKKNN